MKRWMVALLAMCMVFTMAACGGSAKDNGADRTAQNGGADVSGGERTAYPFTVKDASGEEFTFTEAPQRIVSIAPNQTEILFALGLGDRIVGVSEFDNYPEEAKSKPKVGNIYGNPEALLAVNPDLVFAGLTLNGTTVSSLRDLGVKVFTTEPTTIDEVIESIILIGKITDTQAAANALARKMREDKQYVIDTVKGLSEDQKKKVYVEYDPLWTAGKGSFIDEMIGLSGGINIASDLGQWAQISSEAVISANPDVIIYAEVNDYETGKPLIETIKSRPGWGQLNAIKNGALTGIDPDVLSRNGPRITEALKIFAKATYPELFDQ